MRKTARESADSPREKYEELLAQSMKLQRQYEVTSEEISKAYGQGREDDAERLENRIEGMRDRFDSLMKQRVDLLRRIEKLRTIEDAFPRVKRPTEVEKKEVDAAALIRAFNAGRVGVDELRKAGRQMEEGKPEDLTDEEETAFAKARAALAREHGYETDNKEPGWITLKKNGIEFSMKHYAFPSEFGITGDSRISKMGVSVTEGKKSEMVLSYDRGWDVACTDPKVQEEIDRAIAIFG